MRAVWGSRVRLAWRGRLSRFGYRVKVSPALSLIDSPSASPVASVDFVSLRISGHRRGMPEGFGFFVPPNLLELSAPPPAYIRIQARWARVCHELRRRALRRLRSEIVECARPIRCRDLVRTQALQIAERCWARTNIRRLGQVWAFAKYDPWVYAVPSRKRVLRCDWQ